MKQICGSALCCLLCLAAVAVRADTLTVGAANARFQSLQAALAAAQPGDTIQVQPGAYIGQFILNKAIKLEGVGKPVLRGTGRGSVVVITADGCTIKGFV